MRSYRSFIGGLCFIQSLLIPLAFFSSPRIKTLCILFLFASNILSAFFSVKQRSLSYTFHTLFVTISTSFLLFFIYHYYGASQNIKNGLLFLLFSLNFLQFFLFYQQETLKNILCYVLGTCLALFICVSFLEKQSFALNLIPLLTILSGLTTLFYAIFLIRSKEREHKRQKLYTISMSIVYFCLFLIAFSITLRIYHYFFKDLNVYSTYSFLSDCCLPLLFMPFLLTYQFYFLYKTAFFKDTYLKDIRRSSIYLFIAFALSALYMAFAWGWVDALKRFPGLEVFYLFRMPTLSYDFIPVCLTLCILGEDTIFSKKAPQRKKYHLLF